MNETVKDLASDTLKSIANDATQRFRGAAVIYIASSWLAYNWSNIALLFMSKAIVEQRIQDIYQRDDLNWNFFWWPIFVGLMLGLVVPVVNSLYAHLQQFWQVIEEKGYESKRNFIEHWNAKRATKLKEEKLKIPQLEDKHALLTAEINSLEAKRKELIKNVEESYENILATIHRSWKLLNDFHDYQIQNNDMSYEKFDAFYKKQFDSSDFNAAIIERDNLRIFGKEGSKLLTEYKPYKTSNELVQELLFVTGVLKTPPLRSNQE